MHSLSDVYALFKINAATLYRWLRRAQITPHQDPVDMRRRYLDDDQLLALARLHNRVLRVDTDAIQLSVIERMQAQIAELDRRLSEQ